MVNVGIIGYSKQNFDKNKARENINLIYDDLQSQYSTVTIVSGYTNLGIPKIAYEEADKRDWRTVGIACEKAEEYEVYSVDKSIIVGEEWGDESDTFLDYIQVLVKIGGGEQSDKEIEHAKRKNIPIYKDISNI